MNTLTRTKGSFGCLFLTLALSLSAGPAQAGDGAKTTSWSGIDRYILAEQLTSQALGKQDVLMLIMAARLKQLTPGTEVQRKPAAGLQRVALALKNKPSPRSAEGLLNKARELAAGRPDLLALIEDVAKERPRGSEDGPKTHRQIAASGATDIYTEAYRPGEAATVLLSGDGESNLDLYVFDLGGKRICASEKLEDVEVCRWAPTQGGRFRIHVVNRGRVDNQYEMRSN